MTIGEYLSDKTYPGRLLLSGTNEDGKPILAYAVMGRSSQSRNRILVKENGVLKTKAYDESLIKDPELIIYPAMMENDKSIIITNGSHTETIYNTLEEGKTLEEAIVKLDYEPDDPNFTPRISLVSDKESGSYILSIVRKKGEDRERIIYRYKSRKGYCHLIHTYKDDFSPLPSFNTDPPCFLLPKTEKELIDILWNNLNEKNKVALYVRYGENETIINAKEN